MSCFEIILCHSSTSLCVTGYCCDCTCSFIDNLTCGTFTIKRAKVVISVVALFSAANFITFIWDLVIVVLHYVCSVSCAAVSDFKVVDLI